MPVSDVMVMSTIRRYHLSQSSSTCGAGWVVGWWGGGGGGVVVVVVGATPLVLC